MPASSPDPRYYTAFDPQTGTPVREAPGIVRITAPNAGLYTFMGTNSYLVGETDLAVVDPGPDSPEHIEALLDAIGDRTVSAIILTHTHHDHSGLVRKLMARTGAPLWSGGPHRLSRPLKPFEAEAIASVGDFQLVPHRELADGDRIDLGGLVLEVVATPGHCANHLAFAVEGREELLSGDHVMGWNSTVIAAPDGDMDDYLCSLDKVIALPQRRYLPGHGGPIADGRAFAKALKSHRMMRNGQLLDLLTAGSLSLEDATRAVYPHIDERLVPGASRTLLAHAEYLAREGRIAITYEDADTRLTRI